MTASLATLARMLAAATARQVRARDESHDLSKFCSWMCEQVSRRTDHFREVVGDEVGSHAHSDPGGAIDEQVRDGCWEHDWLGLSPVVVGREVDGLLIDRRGHRQGRRRKAGLGVPHGCWPVIWRAEVAMAVDHRKAKRERLGHPHQRVVDR